MNNEERLQIAKENGAIRHDTRTASPDGILKPCVTVSFRREEEFISTCAAIEEATEKSVRESCANVFLANAKGCWTNAEMAEAIRGGVK